MDDGQHADQAKDMLKVMLQQEVEYRPHHQPSHHVDPTDRHKLIRWCFQVMEYCKLDQTLAEVVMSYTDRYVSVVPMLWTRTRYQLVAMTALYTTVKIFGIEAMDPMLVSIKLSRGAYTVDEIEQQERDLLRVLEWRMNPPTSSSFIGLYLTIVVRYMSLSISEQFAVYECAMEYAMNCLLLEGSPHIPKPSEVAFIALVTALRRESYACDETIAWATSFLPVQYNISYNSVKPLPPIRIGSPQSVVFPTTSVITYRCLIIKHNCVGPS